MHWADVIADELAKENKKHVLATGITPSGPIHIGNMREVLTTDAVYRSLIKKDVEAEFIYIADDYDHLRKVYPYLPKTYETHVGKPICEIPCPCGKHKSYADHYLIEFLSSLEEVGIKPSVYRASEMYKQGLYNDAIQTALEKINEIRKIIETISKRNLPKNWIPFNVKCEKCSRLTTTKSVLYEYPFIEYKCECGFEGSADIRKTDIGKLPWRLDWPARWKMLKVTFEPFGKDLGTIGGARQTGEKIVKEIYGYNPPKFAVYEFILLKGQGAMHSSTGTALSAGELLHMTPPEVLRFLIMKYQPNKHIVFDPGLGLLNLVDESDQFARIYFGVAEKIKGMTDLDTIPFQIPYRHLVTLVQIGKTWDNLIKILKRTGQLSEELNDKDEKRLKQRIEHVKYWLDKFAPDMVKFRIQKVRINIKINNDEKTIIHSFIKKIDKTKWRPEDIHNLIYEISEKEKINSKIAFTIIYRILLNQQKGPRVGFFLSNLDKEFVLKKFKEAVK